MIDGKTLFLNMSKNIKPIWAWLIDPINELSQLQNSLSYVPIDSHSKRKFNEYVDIEIGLMKSKKKSIDRFGNLVYL